LEEILSAWIYKGSEKENAISRLVYSPHPTITTRVLSLRLPLSTIYMVQINHGVVLKLWGGGSNKNLEKVQ
jgi:hypothetical protein